MGESDSLKVTEHISLTDIQFQETLEFLRAEFLNADPEIAEHIKWNSPGFYYKGTMKAFDPREYKRDLAVLNLHRGKILVVFPTGNKIDAKIGLKGKDFPDGRKIVEITDLIDAKAKLELLKEGIKNWITQIEK